MRNSYDVLVVGAGMAGVTAAKAAADEGLSVGLLSKGEGASVLGSGALDLLGAVPAAEGNLMVAEIEEGLELLLQNQPDHPYRFLKNNLRDGVKAFCELCDEGGLQFYGDGIQNQMVPNTLGTVKNSAYLPYTSKDACLDKLNGQVLIVGFGGHSDFYAEYAAKSLNDYVQNFAPDCTARFVATTIVPPANKGKTKLSNAELAEWLDSESGIAELSGQLQELLGGIESISHVMLPPVLGYRHFVENKKALEEVLQLPVSELVTGGHSVAGQRLVNAMRTGASKVGIDYRPLTSAESIQKEGETFTVAVSVAGKQHKITAKAVVLATGGFVGGGLKAYREDISAPLLDEPVGRVQPEMLQMQVFAAGGQPFSKLGLKAYDDLRLAQGAHSGRVFLCGDLMEGYDWVYERSGGGVAVASGYLAGKNAAKMAKEGVGA